MDVQTVLTIVGIAMPTLLTIVGIIAEKTKNTTDDKIVMICRKIWSVVPIGETDVSKMGRK